MVRKFLELVLVLVTSVTFPIIPIVAAAVVMAKQYSDGADTALLSLTGAACLTCVILATVIWMRMRDFGSPAMRPMFRNIRLTVMVACWLALVNPVIWFAGEEHLRHLLTVQIKVIGMLTLAVGMLVASALFTCQQRRELCPIKVSR